MILNNLATLYGAGAYEGTLYNCLLTYNIASNSISFYGLGGGAYLASLYNCTVVSNSATGGGGGIYGGMPYNSIIFFNTATIGGQNWTNNPLTSFSPAYCCTTPKSGYYIRLVTTNDPMFVNAAGGDFHLQYNSPCINAGNNAYVSTTNDLDSNRRIVGYAVDSNKIRR